jgi:hypothetical protein
MGNPYSGKPDSQFWSRAVARPDLQDVDPVGCVSFRINSLSKIATAGSCFAQHIARMLMQRGYGYLVTEARPAFSFSENENYGTFTARYGNIYTVRQLRQLFQRAYAVYEPDTVFWARPDGRLIDPFRPQIQAGGFGTEEELLCDRQSHLSAVREAFETCNIFVFTLGLTEGWESTIDGAVFPLAPGTVAPGVDEGSYRFHNFSVAEMVEDLTHFISDLRGVNPDVRIILSVSPVPLIATFEQRHVLTANSYSKSALRVVAEQLSQSTDRCDYFPSYEMITGLHTRGLFYHDDLRQVRIEGVEYVMKMFARHYLGEVVESEPFRPAPVMSAENGAALTERAAAMEALGAVICDEETIERSL